MVSSLSGLSVLERIFGREISERKKLILRTVIDVSLLILLTTTFIYIRDVYRARHEICVNPSEHCPFNEYTRLGEDPNVDWGLLSEQVNLAEVNKTEIEENLYWYLAKGIECQKGN